MIKNKIFYTRFTDWQFKVSKAKGDFLWDNTGKKYLDFTAGWNVANLGWNNPEINEAMIRQIKKNVYLPGWTSDPIQEEYAEALTRALPKELTVCFHATGGTEANEEALKIARGATGRKKIIGIKDTYHGQSFGTMSIGYRPEYVTNISPMVGGFIQLDSPDPYRSTKNEQQVLEHFLIALEKELKTEEVAAILTEAGMITGWGSGIVFPRGYLKEVRRLTKKYRTLLILDEVGTGFSRMGKLFGMEIESVVPDIVTFAKGISNGAAAIGTMVTTSALAKRALNVQTYSTFGWTPVACVAALKTLQIHQRDKVWQKSKRDGEYLLTTLKKELINHPYVGDIRGIGMELAIDFVKNKKTKAYHTNFLEKVVAKCCNSGLLVVSDHTSVMPITPPLTIDRKNLNQGVEILIKTIREV